MLLNRCEYYSKFLTLTNRQGCPIRNPKEPIYSYSVLLAVKARSKAGLLFFF
ncbi:hypothetical protein KIS4809_4243 [Bacillus sp. ZZV12-4809]|nr:hypothetical protein KIS4809_4243 [Bacillus sp. ZZV12-4809]